MKFTKMQGLENDYVYIDVIRRSIEDPAALARAVSDRHTGIGGDGLILIGRSGKADVRMVVYNADGSRAQVCGNGLRCVAKYAVDHELVQGLECRIETDDGVKTARCCVVDHAVRSVRVDMGRPVLDVPAIPATIRADRITDHPLSVSDRECRVTCVSMGNPHAVVFSDNLDSVDMYTMGSAIERAPEFPERINVHFARVESPGRVVVRTWERGSGATRACGTGACAVCVAAAITHRAERRIEAVMPGGVLDVEWADDDHLYMTGPAVEVFTGDWPE